MEPKIIQNEIIEAQRQAAPPALQPANMDQAMRLAEMMSKGALVPKHLQGKPADCLMVIEQSIRWKMSPFAVAQATSVINGKLMFEGKLVAAAVHNSGLLRSRLNFDFSGTGDTRAVTVTGTLKGEDTPRSVQVLLREARTNNAMWQRQPDQQLCYSGTRVWARRHAPEVMLGVYSPEEDFEPSSQAAEHDVTPAAKDNYPDPDIKRNLPRWKDLVRSGKKSPDDIIAMIETKFILNDVQKGTIRHITNTIAAEQAEQAAAQPQDEITEAEWSDA